ncbi:acyl-coenzyme A thioesterase 3-like [Oratosquilla oratoria]|uniref:acyl-coenzyme A thioesterase 3-like n=1 Tax=Oratosquilla oratoria TaxID=337810 RepID=UPI003F775697
MLKFGPSLGRALRASSKASYATRELSKLTQPISQISLNISPRICLYDVPPRITVKGLEPRTPVTLKSSLVMGKEPAEFVSHAHYVADDKGEVNVSRDFSVGGSYEGVFPMGLLTTLSPAPGVRKYTRAIKADAVTPETVHVSLYEDHLPIEAHFAESERARPEAVASCELERHVMAPGVLRIPVRQGRIRGTLFLPPGPGPFPGVLDTFGGGGGLNEIRSALLASRGIASLVLALFDFEDLPKDLERIELEYFEEAVDFILDQPGVIPDRCGFVSICQSSFLALACGAWMDKVKAVVTIAGFPYILGCRMSYKDREYQGDPIDGTHLVFKEKDDKVFIDKKVFSNKLKPEYPYNVPVEEADEDTYFLAIGGDKDAMHIDKSLQVLQGRLTAHGRSDKVKTVLYPGLGHFLEVPYTPHFEYLWQRFPPHVARLTGRKGAVVNYGSDQPHLYSIAQAQHWVEIHNFIFHHIRDESPWYQNYIRGEDA